LAAGAVICGCSKAPENSMNAGNGGQTAADAAVNIADSDPKVVVAAFLDAVRTGDDKIAMTLLTATARQKAEETGRDPTAASSTAHFELGEVEKVGEDGARVACTWTDLDDSHKPQSQHALWICRHEKEGWRVCGVAATVFPGEDPLLLNFEDPVQMEHNQKWLKDETIRRSKAQNSPPQNASTPVEAERKPQDAFRR